MTTTFANRKKKNRFLFVQSNPDFKYTHIALRINSKTNNGYAQVFIKFAEKGPRQGNIKHARDECAG